MPSWVDMVYLAIEAATAVPWEQFVDNKTEETAPSESKPAPVGGKDCVYCNSFRSVSHAHALARGAARSCGPNGLAPGVGGTIPLIRSELDRATPILQSMPEFMPILQSVQRAQGKLEWVADCAQAASIADDLEEAETNAHEITRQAFAATKG